MTVLVFFLSASQTLDQGNPRPQLRVPFWILGARMLLDVLVALRRCGHGVAMLSATVLRDLLAPRIVPGKAEGPAQWLLYLEALQQLGDREVVHLDEERKATMVSNLLVVLCGDRDAQPVVNTGTLYG